MPVFGNKSNPQIDSGRIQVNDNAWTLVSFKKPFTSIPNVILTMEDEVGIIENLSVRVITLTNFQVHQELKTASTKWIQWIAIK